MSYTTSSIFFSSPLRKSAAEMEKKSTDNNKNKPAVWDCGSSLYDSVELKAFNRQLQHAIAAAGTAIPVPPSVVEPPTSSARSGCTRSRKKTGMPPAPSRAPVPKSVNRMLRAVFRVGQASDPARSGTSAVENKYFVAVDGWMDDGLETVPEEEEKCEKDSGAKPKRASVEGRTLSERWFAGRTRLMCQ